MKAIILLALSCITLHSFAQTDIIEMRSRNVSLKNYELVSIESNDHISSNFGMLVNPEVRTAVLDSVKAVSDSVAVMYTSNYCTRDYPMQMEPQFYVDSAGNIQELDPSKRTYPNPRVGSLWQPGADTVFYHPLFSHTHSLDSIKEELDSRYYFNLPSDSITFIGFDNGQGFFNEDSVQPTKHKRKRKKNSFGWELIFMIVTPIVFLLGMTKLRAIRSFEK